MTFPDIEDSKQHDQIFSVPRRFYLDRSEDMTGVSGIGVVATGVVFPDGRVALQWLPPKNVEVATSMVMWQSVGDMMAIHGHHNFTALRWID